FGDGLRCAAGTVVRLRIKTNVAGASQFPETGDPSVSSAGLVPAGGGVRDYQCWYRNSDPTFCTSATFNLTNGLQITWSPESRRTEPRQVPIPFAIGVRGARGRYGIHVADPHAEAKCSRRG